MEQEDGMHRSPKIPIFLGWVVMFMHLNVSI